MPIGRHGAMGNAAASASQLKGGVYVAPVKLIEADGA
jgi:hypothetical protein